MYIPALNRKLFGTDIGGDDYVIFFFRLLS